MMPLYIFSNRTFVLAAMSVAAVFLASIVLYQFTAPPVAALFNTSSAGGAVSLSPGKAYLSAQAAAAATVPARSGSEQAPMMETHIANNGLVLLRGARVVSVSGDTIRVAMAWGPANFTWVANTSFNTTFTSSNGEKGTIANIQTGDVVTVTGMLTAGGYEPTIDAKFVRE